jgi:hypothetical protein
MNPSTPLFEHRCWYLPDDAKNIFGTKKGIVSVVPGALIIKDPVDGREVRHLPLTSNITYKSLGGRATMWIVDGRMIDMAQRRFRMVYFVNPTLTYLGIEFILIGRKQAKLFTQACQAASVASSVVTS